MEVFRTWYQPDRRAIPLDDWQEVKAMSDTSHKQPWAEKPAKKKGPPQQRFLHGQIARHRPTHTQHTGERRS